MNNEPIYEGDLEKGLRWAISKSKEVTSSWNTYESVKESTSLPMQLETELRNAGFSLPGNPVGFGRLQMWHTRLIGSTILDIPWLRMVAPSSPLEWPRWAALAHSNDPYDVLLAAIGSYYLTGKK